MLFHPQNLLLIQKRTGVDGCSDGLHSCCGELPGRARPWFTGWAGSSSSWGRRWSSEASPSDSSATLTSAGLEGEQQHGGISTAFLVPLNILGMWRWPEMFSRLNDKKAELQNNCRWKKSYQNRRGEKSCDLQRTGASSTIRFFSRKFLDQMQMKKLEMRSDQMQQKDSKFVHRITCNTQYPLSLCSRGVWKKQYHYKTLCGFP